MVDQHAQSGSPHLSSELEIKHAQSGSPHLSSELEIKYAQSGSPHLSSDLEPDLRRRDACGPKESKGALIEGLVARCEGDLAAWQLRELCVVDGLALGLMRAQFRGDDAERCVEQLAPLARSKHGTNSRWAAPEPDRVESRHEFRVRLRRKACVSLSQKVIRSTQRPSGVLRGHQEYSKAIRSTQRPSPVGRLE